MATTTTTEKATKDELAVLRWAVREASTWRGALIGGDERKLRVFDEKIKTAKLALRRLKKVAE